jgi:uncharacterized membrane-anchored protein
LEHLGVSIGDLLSQPIKAGGFGWGTTGTSMVFRCIIASFILDLSLKPNKQSFSADISKVP